MNPPRGYRVGVVLAAVFALLGVTAVVFALVLGTAGLQEQMGFAPGPPFWTLLVIAILSEVIGVIGLIRRARWAVPALALSLIFTVLFYGYLIHLAGQAGKAGGLSGPIIITGLHMVLLWFSVHSRKRGWLR